MTGRAPSPDGVGMGLALMGQAQALWRFAAFAEDAERESGDAQSEEALFLGALLGVPILLALAVEIALKAWQARDSGDHDRGRDGHHLLKLYGSRRIKAESKAEIGAAVEGVPFWTGHPVAAGGPPDLLMQFPPDAETYIRAVLGAHATTFVDARYHVETLSRRKGMTVWTSHLHRVLKALIQAFPGAA